MLPKFRVWDKFYECMITPVGIELENGEVSHIIEQLPGETTKSSITYYKLMQSTGLKDKNGVEIFEGDVLKVFIFDGKGPHTKVIFKNGMFGIEDDMFGYGYDKGLYPLDQIISIRDTEIIGNKYEHPHLIEGDNE
ncbi:YopX family protein [Staphylococcus equorum]|uniref:YopX family protein n=1 Tax=Staphylococcus equorum TaxID=246432 RepID=UPI00192CE5F7|nr:YopX family protein [Staphylococcus equorum]